MFDNLNKQGREMMIEYINEEKRNMKLILNELQKMFPKLIEDRILYGYIRPQLSVDEKIILNIMYLDKEYCKLAGKIDGEWFFSYDFKFFENKESLLGIYPIEFTEKYEIYKNDKITRWQELNYKTTICISIDSDDEILKNN